MVVSFLFSQARKSEEGINVKYVSSDFFIDSELPYPDLLEATVEQLVAGLETEAWTSVDLTKVKHPSQRENSFLIL